MPLSGVNPVSVRGSRTGVFVGCMTTEAVDMWTADVENVTGLEITGSTQSLIANRVSYFFDFKGSYTTSFMFITARCTLVQSAVLRPHVVSLSVRLSVTLVDCDHIGWISSKIISPLVSLGCSLSADPNIMGLLQGEHP